MNEIIHCIGDSHASFFSGKNKMQPTWPAQSKNLIPVFKSYRLGAVLAYSLPDLGTTMRGREKLLEILKSIPQNSFVLSCFGEIDCRVHLLKQAGEQGRDVKEVTEECARRYFSVILELKKRFRPIIWAAPASTISEKIIDLRYPHVGSCKERNRVTEIFNNTLEKLALENEIIFLSIFKNLITKDYITRNKFYIDEVHLSQRAMPFVIKQLKIVHTELDIRLFKSKTLSVLPFRVQFVLFVWKCEIKTMVYKFYVSLKTKVKGGVANMLGEKISEKIRSVLYNHK